jgi:DNA-binding transcriptional regulator YhcF (GntR family)
MAALKISDPDRMLSRNPRDLYDARSVPDAAGEPVNPSEAATITAVAALVRGKILRGEYPAGRVDSRKELAEHHGISPESAGVVLRMMRDEGLVTLEQGRGTYVCPLHAYLVTVSMPSAAGSPVSSREADRQVRRMTAAEKAEPAVADLDLATGPERWEWQMTVRSADPARASLIGLSTVMRAAGDGWDVSAAKVSAEPT